MASERIHKSFGQSSLKKKHSLIVPPLIDQQTQVDSQQYQQDRFEATKLEIQAKYGTITPIGQERLTFLQAKKVEFWQRHLENTRRNSRDFSMIPVHRQEVSPVQAIQAKLTIGAPGDKYEQEADRVASLVVNQINAPVTPQKSQNLQCEAIPEEEGKLQMKPMLQLRGSGVSGMAAMPDLESSIQQARSGGQPLAEQVRKPMEQAFRADFSRVKVHTDAQSNQLNKAIQARAFTTKQDVFFRSGEYNPGSRGGQELIAHELTHVVQQNGEVAQRSLKTHERAEMLLKENNSKMIQCLRATDFNDSNVNTNGSSDQANILDTMLTAIRGNINGLDYSQWWQHVQEQNHNTPQPVGNASTFQQDTQQNILRYIQLVIRSFPPAFNNSVLVFNSTSGNICNGMHQGGPRRNVRVTLDINALTDDQPMAEQLESIIVTNAFPIN